MDDMMTEHEEWEAERERFHRGCREGRICPDGTEHDYVQDEPEGPDRPPGGNMTCSKCGEKMHLLIGPRESIAWGGRMEALGYVWSEAGCRYVLPGMSAVAT